MANVGGILPWILASGTLASLLVLLLSGRRSRVDDRISQLSIPNRKYDSQKYDSQVSLGESVLSVSLKRRIEQEKKKQDLRERLLQGGFYGRNAAQWLIAARILSMIIPVVLGWVTSQVTLIPISTTMFLGFVVGLLGALAPSFVLDSRKKARQQRIRRSLPDAMDILNVCLEGGMSLPGSFSRVSQEMITAHPELALELAIVDRETRMGRTVAESVRSFADRFDLEELRSMASVIAQAERYGASVASAMDVFAESMREKRTQIAETKAQQAVVKIIFPTLFCIFPALFVVILGPAAIQIYETLVVNGPMKK